MPKGSLHPEDIMTTPFSFIAESPTQTWDPQTSWERVQAPRAKREREQARSQ